MEKKTTLKGMWWVKGNEQDKFVGILTYGIGYRPTLEIYPKEYEFDSPKVPEGSTLYGDVFGDSRSIQAVTLLECTSPRGWGTLDVGAYIYKQEYVRAECVAIGMQLKDEEIVQVQSPKDIYLTCPGLDEYSFARTLEYVWKDNAPSGRAYRVSDLKQIVYTQPDDIEIEIDIGKITIYLGGSSSGRNLSSSYRIHISLSNPTPKAEVNSLIYSQLLSFVSTMTGRMEYISKHSTVVKSHQTGSGSLSLELNYGHINQTTDLAKFDVLQALLRGRDLEMFASLFPKWRENFSFVENLAFHYLRMLDESTVTNLLEAFPHIDRYALDRLSKRKKGLAGTLCEVIHAIVDYFSCSSSFAKHYPIDRISQIARHIANFRHNHIHPRSEKECNFSSREVYAHIVLIMRAIFLMEMKYPYTDVDAEINHWPLWRQLKVD